MSAHRVDLVDEDDAGRVLLALLEHVAHARCAHAHEHLDEVGTGDGEERHVGLAGDRPGKQRLARSRRPHQQASLGNLAAQTLELRRILQELDDLLELLLRLVDARHVLEGDPPGLLGEQPRPALAEAHRLAAAGLHLAHEKHPDADQQQHREPGDQHAPDRRRAIVERLCADADAVLLQPGYEIRIIRRVGGQCATVAKGAGDLPPLDRDLAHVAALDLRQEVGVSERLLRAARRRALKEIEQGEHQQRDDHP